MSSFWVFSLFTYHHFCGSVSLMPSRESLAKYSFWSGLISIATPWEYSLCLCHGKKMGEKSWGVLDLSLVRQASSHILWNAPSRPSAVDSITIDWPTWTVFKAPVTISRAFSGFLAQTLPNSEICKYWRVEERKDVPTRMEEPWEKESSLAESPVVLNIARTAGCNWSKANLSLSWNIEEASSRVWAIRPACILSFHRTWSKWRIQ